MIKWWERRTCEIDDVFFALLHYEVVSPKGLLHGCVRRTRGVLHHFGHTTLEPCLTKTSDCAIIMAMYISAMKVTPTIRPMCSSEDLPHKVGDSQCRNTMNTTTFSLWWLKLWRCRWWETSGSWFRGWHGLHSSTKQISECHRRVKLIDTRSPYHTFLDRSRCCFWPRPHSKPHSSGGRSNSPTYVNLAGLPFDDLERVRS